MWSFPTAAMSLDDCSDEARKRLCTSKLQTLFPQLFLNIPGSGAPQYSVAERNVIMSLIPHTFTHIAMVYHAESITMAGHVAPPAPRLGTTDFKWLNMADLANASLSTGFRKVLKITLAGCNGDNGLHDRKPKKKRA